MNFLRFFRKKKSAPSQQQSRPIQQQSWPDEIPVISNGKDYTIKIDNQMSLEAITQLLKTLRKHKIAFSVHDRLLYSYEIGDPGAYVTYSQDKNDLEDCWSMTFGNHGWSGGTFTIEEKNIALQLFNLAQKEEIDSIRIGNVRLFNYEKKNPDRNKNMNALLYTIHSNLPSFKPDFLIFGIFKSGDYPESYTIYKLTDTQLFADTRGIWHSDRFTSKGYVFEGLELSDEKRNKVKALINGIPLELLTRIWDSFYETENKNEDKLVLAFSTAECHKTIIIDEYIRAKEKLPPAIRDFRITIEKLVEELD
ncbi:hypothetical protein [Flavobacterium cerinum]|uniref:Uncharacterized protein n=1 Tax=Flavobacterium cerinum TaxID=2502784 RepID=A0ABY5IXJ4_9FLAO|nr:hypothetical protein [Flavobacterium cerinum]UUC47156.1 hypothetical protein NOX80_08145 [Flavobacterium cerinum]